jgi:glyoxylase-like metal-dependent hydrolase (beta-lactamase superfamily II)
MGRGIRPDRVLAEGERFDFDGVALRIRALPSGGRFAAGLFAEIDGLRYAFTGDAVAAGPMGVWFPRPTWRLGLSFDARPRTLRTLIDEAPDWTCPGRGTYFRVHRDRLSDDLLRAESDLEQWRALLPEPPDWALSPDGVTLYPYRIPAVRGEQFGVELRVRNPTEKPMAVRASLVTPTEWMTAPDPAEFTVPPAGSAAAAFDVLVPRPFVPAHPVQSIAADVWIDGVPRGQLADALVRIGEIRPPTA